MTKKNITPRKTFEKWIHDKDYISIPTGGIISEEQKTTRKENAMKRSKVRDIPDTNVCNVCKRELPSTEFRQSDAYTKGIVNTCRECERERNLKNRELDKAQRAKTKERHDKAKAAALKEKEATKLSQLEMPAVEKRPIPAAPEKLVIEKRPLAVDPAAEQVELTEGQVRYRIIPSPVWIGYIPDDALYAELLARGWKGSMFKQLTHNQDGQEESKV